MATRRGKQPDPRLRVLAAAAALCPTRPCKAQIVAPPVNPLIALSPDTRLFTAVAGGANPASQPVNVLNAGNGTLTNLAVGTIVYGGAAGWLTATLSSSSVPSVLTLQPATGALPVGVHTAFVPVADISASNSPQSVSVTFTVTAPQPFAMSFVSFDSGLAEDGIPGHEFVTGNLTNPLYVSWVASPAIPGSTGAMRIAGASGSARGMQVQTPGANFGVPPKMNIDGMTTEMFIRREAGALYNIFFTIQIADDTIDNDGATGYFDWGRRLVSEPVTATMESYFYDSDAIYGGDSAFDVVSLAWPEDTWIHVAQVFDGPEMRTYVAGQLINTRPAPAHRAGGIKDCSFTLLWVGSNHPTPVYVDSARVFAGALYTGASFTPPTAAFPAP